MINTHHKSRLWVSPKTVMCWFRHFRSNDESFVNHPARKDELSKDPPFFDINPDLKQMFISHARENLANLTTEFMFQYVHDVLVPTLLEQERIERENDNLEVG